MERGAYGAGSGRQFFEAGADPVGQSGFHEVDAEDGFVAQQALKLGAVGLLTELHVRHIGLSTASSGSGEGSNAFPLSSAAIRYRSKPANTSGMSLRSLTLSVLEAR